jgi:Flp pilus assembly protein TadD
MSSKESSSQRGAGPVWLCLATLVVGAPLALGGTHPVVVAGLGLGAAFLLGLQGWSRRRQGRRFLPGSAPLVFLGGALYSALQAVPLPRWLVGVLSPARVELHDVMAVAGGTSWVSLSGAPQLSLVAAGALVTVACVAAVAGDLCRQSDNPQRVLRLVAVAGLAVMAAGVAHWLQGWEGPLGLAPAGGHALLRSTFVNPSHAAAVLVMGAFASLGLALHAQVSFVALNWAVAALFCAVGVFLCGATAAVLAVFAGVAVTTALVWNAVSRSRDDRRSAAPRRGSRTIALSALAALAPLVALILARPSWLGFSSGGTTRPLGMEVVREAARALPHYALAGMGRGAFAEVFPRHKESLADVTVVSPENVVLLLALEWGLLVAVVYLVALLVPVARRMLSSPSVVVAAALGGLVALGLHNLADFNLETLGVAIPFAALLATTRPRPGLHEPPNEERKRKAKLTSMLAIRLGAVSVLACVPAVWVVVHGQEPSRRRALGAPLLKRVDALQTHLEAHPTDYIAALAVARHLRVVAPGDPGQALAWVNRALFLSPTFAESHLDAARLLWVMGRRDQAALEYGVAHRLGGSRHDDAILDELVAAGMAVEEAWQVFSGRDERWVCDRLTERGRLGLAEGCWQRLAVVRPGDAGVQAALADRALSRGALDEAVERARKALAAEPASGAAAVSLSRALAAKGEPGAAERVLEEARAARADPVEVERERFEQAVHRGDLAGARKALAGYGAAVSLRGGTLEDVIMAEGRLEERAGNALLAIQQYKNAARANPRRPEAALRAAELAAAAGEEDVAVGILRDASMAYPHASYFERINMLEANSRTAGLRSRLRIPSQPAGPR